MNHLQRRADDPYVQLAAAVLTGAYRDLVNTREVVRDKARYFFDSHRFELWADMLRVDYGVVKLGARSVEADGLPLGDGRRERYRRANGM